jgi:aminopeptidase N
MPFNRRRSAFAALTGATAACTELELPLAGRDLDRDLEHLDLRVDTRSRLGEAAISVARSDSDALTLEVAELEIESVTTLDGVELDWAWAAGDAPALSSGLLDIGVPAREDTVVVTYVLPTASGGGGYFPEGYTLTWPGDCGSLFPCHSDPADGLTWTLDVTADRDVITSDVEFEAPSYMLAWRESDDQYQIELGVSDGGVALVAFPDADVEDEMRVGTERLVAMFNWLEGVLGPYPYGDTAGPVAVPWGENGLGGMEHHPYWHVNSPDVDWPMVHGHEAAHGWYGNGVRLACWEDMFISEGIVSYLGLRAVEQAYGDAAGEAEWANWATNLEFQLAVGDHPARPDGCNDVDGAEMIDFVVYGKGAFFLKAVADEVGREAVDAALGDFNRAHLGGTASVDEFLVAFDASTGFDSSELAAAWIYGLGMPPAELGGF